MKSSLNLSKKSSGAIRNKISVFLLVFVMLFSFLTVPVHTAKAIPVEDVPAFVWNKVQEYATKLWKRGGSTAFQSTVRTALNKIAYDTATYLGSGDKGQKPLFITQDWGDYLAQIGDEAAGEFVESFANNLAISQENDLKKVECQNKYQECSGNCITFYAQSGEEMVQTDPTIDDECLQNCKTAATSCDASVDAAAGGSLKSGQNTQIGTASVSAYNVCQPSSLQAKVKIGLGLVQFQRASAPNCTATKMIQNWGDEVQRYKDMKEEDFLKKFSTIFNPTSNDLGIYMTAREGLHDKQTIADENSRLNLAANKGWQGKTNAAKKLIGTPGDAEAKRDSSGNLLNQSLGKVTGDIIVDAANVFLNQYAITKFNDLLSKLGDKSNSVASSNLNDEESDPGVSYGEGSVKEVASSIIKPNFGVEADYDILSQLSICLDPKNPGPTNCVIDEKFAQGVSEKKTVAEAIKSGYLHGDWQISKDTVENTYSLRNISILRKYRIVPIGWEEAVNKAFANQNSIKKVTIGDLVSCYDPTDSYNQFSSDFDTHNQAWCRGLVDPNWVLKAPLNYCRKKGVSSQILNRSIIASVPAYNGNPYTPSVLNVFRAEEYCADEQTCIKEKDDGSCDVYGYCNEEKRTWKFSSDSCEPIYNTCRSFTNPITNKNVSYLENTLNYSGCSSESAGCRQYSTYGSYATTTGTVSWDANRSIYLNKNLSACNGKDEGCTELLRVKPTWGSNMIMDSDLRNEEIGDSANGSARFNDWAYWSSSNTINNSRTITVVDAAQEPGGPSEKALKLEVTRVGGNTDYPVVGIFTDVNNSLLPDNFQLIPGHSYTVSADVYLEEGHAVHLYQGQVENGFVNSTGETGKWLRLSVTRVASGAYSEPYFGINADSSMNNVKVYIKNLKFEVSNFATGASSYGNFKVYEKLIPSYLEKACYTDITSATKDYRLRSDAPSACSKFARKCNREEVGCELYTGIKNGLSVPAQVTTPDYCPGECVGYDVYISKEDNFNSPQSDNLIPTTAVSCGAEAVGCSEFTNLDELNQGGESKEYYSVLKRCIKPSASLCGSFYSWEGTDGGYQLRSYNLQKDAQGNPAVTASDAGLCDASIYNKPLGDPEYNPDCREFYNAAGQVSYHLMARTITCSENCHSYRMSQKNIDKTLTQAQCNALPAGAHWDATINACYVCMNGGAWDNQLNACIYQAIPGEGKSCSAQENGCREYNGNSGNNVKMLAYYNFESGDQGWSSNCTGGAQLTTISNNKDGHSLLYRDNAPNCAAIEEETQTTNTSREPLIKKVFASANVVARLKVGTTVSQGNAYTLRFIAKADEDTIPQIYFYNNDATNPQKAWFASSTLVVKGGGEWNVYQTNLDNLDHAVTANERLMISANHDFYFDDVVLTEITDRYYLIKDSSVIPDICYYDINDNYQGENYNLGCSQYIDRNKLKHNLRKFSKLCSGEAVGCEQMIATNNYAPYEGGIWSDTNSNGVCDSTETDCIKVDRDKAIYAVYDSSKQCNVADLGCSRLGQGISGTIAWSDVYKKNNPNQYDTTLCGQAEVGCEEWRGSDGASSYFRDPGNETCVYRASQDLTITGKAWYKIPVKRCDSNINGKIEGIEKTGRVCNSINDCSGKPCIIDTNDYPCSTSYLKTFGPGGAGNQIPTPDQQAGLCDATASGCTEYIDPVSKFAPNLIYNPSYESGVNGPEGWAAGAQTVTIEPNKVYIFSTRDNNSNVPTVLTFITGVRELLNDNTLATTTTTLTIPAQTDQNRLFVSMSNSKVVVSGGAVGKIIEIKTAITSYQLQENIDKKSCNGVVNLDSGCVLFNERSVNGSNGLATMVNKYDAQISLNGQAPVACVASSTGSCSANQLIKVTPNRVCSKWLDCMTYTQDPETKERTCFAVGECTRLNDKNECASFEDAPMGSITYDSAGQNKNSTGYYLLNKYHLSNMIEVGMNANAHYDFEDSVPAISCKRADNSKACVFNKNIIADLLVREPEKAPNDYPAHGASYVRVPAAYLVSPQSNNSWATVIADREYFLNFLVNTKNTGLGARVIIKTRGNNNTENLLAEKTFYSNNGWTRQIFQFNPGSATQIKIYLGSTSLVSDREVYFDDLNIEPVLEINTNGGEKEYVTRDCRLYPTNDSLTCVNKNNNVLKDGWEGYCLERDPNNKDVCLMWYPVDAISSSLVTRNTSGYQGKFPLNYCTEINGNFDLVEKIVGVKVQDYLDMDGDSGVDNFCPQKLPKNCASSDPNCCSHYCGDCTNYDAVVTKENQNNNNWYQKTYCLPTSDNNYARLKLKGPLLNLSSRDAAGCNYAYYNEAWAIYNGDLQKVRYSCDAEDGCTDINEQENINPVRVYDHDHIPADEDGLKLISGSDPDDIFRLTCNRFVQVVDNNGENKAWAARTSVNSIWTTSTPPYFVDKIGANQYNYFGKVGSLTSVHSINAYGRNRQDVPFGAALWPDTVSLFNSEAVRFRNQFSTRNDEDVLAGRPYGCSNYNGTDQGHGCTAIGYCSLDPSVYCLMGDASSSDIVSRKTCGDGGYGVCVPLWQNYLGRTDGNANGESDFSAILSRLFLKSYNSYKYQDGAYVPGDVSIDKSPTVICDPRPADTYATSNATIQDNFCYVPPKIGNRVVVKYNNQIIATSGNFYIPKKGVYSLEFNTIIDPEQQPLKEIYIAWGDGESEQLITGQDSRPNPDNPHVFYHYYKKTGGNGIMINIRDNWEKVGEYGSCTYLQNVCVPPVLN